MTQPGLILPTQKSFIPGAGNPRDSALMAGKEMNAKQASLNASVGGRKRKIKGGKNVVAVPQFQMQYTPQGGVGTNPNDQIKATSSTSMQSNAWAVHDNQANKMGGRKTKRKKCKKCKSKKLNRKTCKKHYRRY